jgi:hypothetical protein
MGSAKKRGKKQATASTASPQSPKPSKPLKAFHRTWTMDEVDQVFEARGKLVPEDVRTREYKDAKHKYERYYIVLDKWISAMLISVLNELKATYSIKDDELIAQWTLRMRARADALKFLLLDCKWQSLILELTQSHVLGCREVTDEDPLPNGAMHTFFACMKTHTIDWKRILGGIRLAMHSPTLCKCFLVTSPELKTCGPTDTLLYRSCALIIAVRDWSFAKPVNFDSPESTLQEVNRGGVHQFYGTADPFNTTAKWAYDSWITKQMYSDWRTPVTLGCESTNQFSETVLTFEPLSQPCTQLPETFENPQLTDWLRRLITVKGQLCKFADVEEGDSEGLTAIRNVLREVGEAEVLHLRIETKMKWTRRIFPELLRRVEDHDDLVRTDFPSWKRKITTIVHDGIARTRPKKACRCCHRVELKLLGCACELCTRRKANGLARVQFCSLECQKKAFKEHLRNDWDGS